MGFFRDVFGKRPKPEVTSSVEVVARGPRREYPDINVKVVGESHYQEALRRIAGRQAGDGFSLDGKLARLVPEPDNPYDHLAVRIEIEGEKVGYLSRGGARRYCKRIMAMIDDGEEPIVFCWMGCTGGENPNIGVRLRFPKDSRLARPAPK